MTMTIRQIWDRTPNETWFYFLLICILTVCIIYIFKDYIRIIRFILTLDGPPIVPVIGNAGYLFDENLMHKISHDVFAKNGPIFRIWLTIQPYVVLLEPKDIQMVLANSKHTEKVSLYRIMHNFLGKGLLTRNVETWTVHRRIIQPAFHLQFLEKFTESFVRCSDRFVKKLMNVGGRDVNITSFVNDAVYEILNETVLGLKFENKDQRFPSDELPFRKGKVLVPYRIIRPWLLIDWIYNMTSAGRYEKKQRNDLASACRQIIVDKRNRFTDDDAEEENISLLDFMIEASKKNPCLTDEEIVNECTTFMLAGQDSVGTTTAITLFLLANNREWLEKCVNELDELFKAEKKNSLPTMQDLKAMKYLEMCIKEASRLYPSVPMFARVLGEDVKLEKHVIPAGCAVIIMPYGTHRLPHHFSDPHTFNPDRFSPKNSADRHPYAYIPFSAGPRNCIGNKFAMLEMKSLISMMLRKFDIKSVSGKEEIQPKFRVTLRAKGGLWIRMTPRMEKGTLMQISSK